MSTVFSMSSEDYSCFLYMLLMVRQWLGNKVDLDNHVIKIAIATIG